MDEDTRNPVEVLAEEFVDRYRRGESPSIHEYIEQHPEHADEIDAVFQGALLVEHMKRTTAWPSSPAAEPRDPMPEVQRLGDYRIVREIGRGGMGVVYEAEQEALKRRVAVKVLVPWAMGSSGRVERFRREAQAAATLHHTNIVQVYGVGEQEGLHYFVMELIDGRGLDEITAAASGGLEPRRAAGIAHQVALALAHAHERGVLHRDVKPANLLLDEEGTAWITDFGLAKVLVDPGGLTEAGDIIGTMRYMPPERFKGLSDARGDVYGLGLVLYELLAGRAAFADRDRGSLLEAVRQGRARPIGELVPDLPVDLATIVAKAIATSPEHRYQTADGLADDLERYIEDRPILARRTGPVERARRWCRRNKTLAAFASVAAAAVLLAAVIGWAAYVVAQGALERESEGRARAEEATRRAEANERMSLDALEGIFESLAGRDEGPPRQGPGPPRGAQGQGDAQLLQTVLAFYDRFAAENRTNPRLRRESARSLLRVGTLRAQAGDDEAAALAYARAAASFEAMCVEFPDDEANVLDLARTLSETSLWAFHSGRLDDAERDARRAVSELLALDGEAQDEVGVRGELARARCRLALVQASRGADDEARTTLTRVAAAGDAPMGGAGRRVDVHLEMSLVHRALAEHAIEAGRDEVALADLDAALALVKEGGDRPPPPQVVAEIARERVPVLRRLGLTEEAEAAEAEAAEADASAGPPGGPGQGAPPRQGPSGDPGGGPPPRGPGR